MAREGSNLRPNWEIVLRALQQQPGDRTVEIDNCKYGWHDGKLCHILYKWKGGSDIFKDPHDEEIWAESEMSLNNFIRLCEDMTEEEIVGIAANAALQSMRRQR